MRGQSTREHGHTRFLTDESGSILPIFALMLFVILGMAALAVDNTNGFLMRDRLQATADAAALAGVSQISSVSDARATAISFAEKNLPSSTNGTVLTSSDVVIGSWGGGTFTPGGAAQNALQVTVHRDQVNNNAVPTVFAGLFSVNELNVVATASAYADFCYMRGVIAGNQVQVDQGATVDPGNCIYGRNQVHLDRDIVVDPGAKIGSINPNNITYDQNVTYDPASLIDANLTPKLANNVANIIDDLQNGTLVPPQINKVVVGNSLPDAPLSGTVYVINGDLNIDKNYAATDVIIAVRGDIHWGKNGSINNTQPPAGGASIGVLATGTIELGKGATVTGATLVAGIDVIFDQLTVATDIAVQAGHNVQLDQDFTLASTYGFPIPGFITAPVRLIN